MPPKFHQLWDYSWGFYSPGICPTGYSEGCAFPTSLATDGSGWLSQGGPIISGETARICCPTGYTCLTGATSSYSKCVATSDTSDLVFGIQVRWQKSDLSILETDPTVPGSTFSATATATASTTQGDASPGSSSTATSQETSVKSTNTTGAETSSSASTSQKMSSSAIIGVAVGASKSLHPPLTFSRPSESVDE